MNRIASFLIAGMFALTLGFAGAPVQAASATTCPTGQKAVKGYTKADGTKVAAYCKSPSKTTNASGADDAPSDSAPTSSAGTAMQTSAAAETPSTALSCAPGKTYVHGYTRASGTKVKGYCRSLPH